MFIQSLRISETKTQNILLFTQFLNNDFALFALELPASQDIGFALGDPPTARRQRERETAVVRRERRAHREQDWEIKGKGSEAGERKERR